MSNPPSVAKIIPFSMVWLDAMLWLLAGRRCNTVSAHGRRDRRLRAIGTSGPSMRYWRVQGSATEFFKHWPSAGAAPCWRYSADRGRLRRTDVAN